MGVFKQKIVKCFKPLSINDEKRYGNEKFGK